MDIYAFTKRFNFNASCMGHVNVDREYFYSIGPDSYFNSHPVLRKLLANAGFSEMQYEIPRSTSHHHYTSEIGLMPIHALHDRLTMKHEVLTEVCMEFGLPIFTKPCSPKKILCDFCESHNLDMSRVGYEYHVSPDTVIKAHQKPEVHIGFMMPNFDYAICAYNTLIDNFEIIKSVGEIDTVYGKQSMALSRQPKKCKSWTSFHEEMVHRGYSSDISSCWDLVTIRENGCVTVKIFDKDPSTEKICAWVREIKAIIDGG